MILLYTNSCNSKACYNEFDVYYMYIVKLGFAGVHYFS